MISAISARKGYCIKKVGADVSHFFKFYLIINNKNVKKYTNPIINNSLNRIHSY